MSTFRTHSLLSKTTVALAIAAGLGVGLTAFGLCRG